MGAFEAKKRIDVLPAEQRRASYRSAMLKMRDTQGRDRLVMQVAVDGSPSIQFLDESGRVVIQLPVAR